MSVLLQLNAFATLTTLMVYDQFILLLVNLAVIEFLSPASRASQCSYKIADNAWRDLMLDKFNLHLLQE